MKASIEEVNAVQKRVTVEVSAEKVSETFTHLFEDIRRQAHLKGFRPGRAPMPMIRKFYGQSVVSDVFEKLIKDNLFDAIQTNELRPVASPVIETTEMPKEGQAYSFTALVDVMPSIELSKYKGLSATVEAYEVTQEMIDEEFNYLVRQKAKTKSVDEGAKAAKGQMATVSYLAKDGDQRIDQLCVEKLPIELGLEKVFTDLDEGITGMGVEEERHIRVKVPEDYNNKELAGKTLDFQVTLHDLKDIVLPELDEEFAKDFGLDSLEALKKAVEDRLQQQAHQSKRQQTETALLDQIVQAHPFEVPPSIVDQVTDSIISELRWPNDQEKEQALKDQEFRKKFRDQAKKRAQNTLALLEIVNKENLQVSDEDVTQHFAKMFGGQAPDAAMLENLQKSMGQQVRENLIFDKAINFLIENANIAEIPKKV